MATTKARLAEQVLRIVQGGYLSDDSDIDSREVILFIEQERDTLVKRMIFESMKIGEFDINGDFISTFDVEVKSDSSLGLYIDTPHTPIHLPNDAGYHDLTLKTDHSVSFIRKSNNASSLFKGLPSENMLNNPNYYIEGSRAYLKSEPMGVAYGTLLSLKLILSSRDIEDNEPLPIPADAEALIIKSVAQLYKIVDSVQQDDRNDLKDNS